MISLTLFIYKTSMHKTVKKSLFIALLLCVTVSLSACRTTRDERIQIGTVTGAAIGVAVGGAAGAAAGAASGAIIGFLAE